MAAQKISKSMTLGEIVAKFPESAQIMLNYGLPCIGCPATSFQTLEQGAKMHGLNDKQIQQMVDEINKAIAEKKKE